jgi:hypothetical protein
MNTKFEVSPPMTRPWPSIVHQYDEYSNPDSSIIGVASLVNHIHESELSAGLFAWTSMFDLCITQTEVAYPYNGPYLRVKPLFNGQIEFRYLDTPDESKQWHRTVPAGEAVPRLRHFLAQLHWFGSAPPDDA